MQVGKGDGERPREISTKEWHGNHLHTFGEVAKEECPNCQSKSFKIYYSSPDVESGTRECKFCRYRWKDLD